MSTLDQYYIDAANNAYALRYSSSYQKHAQQFTPSATKLCDTIDISIYKSASPSGNVWVEIWSDTGADLPNAQIGSDSSTVACSSITDSAYPGTMTTFTFASPIALTAGTKYWIVFDGDYAESTTDWVAWDNLETGYYEGGRMARMAVGTWYDQSPRDFRFNEYYSGDSGFTSVYPPSHDATYVKATSTYGAGFEPYRATNPANSVTGDWTNGSWGCGYLTVTNQRFHIDLGSAKIVRRIYYENMHYMGAYLGDSAKNFTFWGSNEASAFAELTYGTDTNWTQLTTGQSAFDKHIGSDVASPKYIAVINTTAYRYYAVKIADQYGPDTEFMGLRRIVLQTQDGYGSNPAGNLLSMFR
jgi:hypothetical protein